MNDPTNSPESETSDSTLSSPAQTGNPPKSKTLPFSGWIPLLAGAAGGIFLRIGFYGKPGNAYAAMMASFIYLAPMLVGAITVYVAETKKRRSWGYYLWAPFLANVIFVLGTLCILIEGMICAIVIVPLFAALGAVGGLMMGVVCRITNWPKQAVYSFAILPLLLGYVETSFPIPNQISAIERTITIAAPPEHVWTAINNAHDIRPEEVNLAWAYRIGVPLPLEGITTQTPEGLVRKIRMGKGIHFDQVSTEWRENRYVRWTYRFQEDSFPPHALDDHVEIGGHYFDLEDTSYTLTPRGNDTELKIRIQYRVSTQFNWYADAVARGLLGNFEDVILGFYRHRSESPHADIS